MAQSPYRRGYEGWEVFDNLPKIVRDAHNAVWTGNPHYTNQFRKRTYMAHVSENDAAAIVALDGGRHMLAASDLDANNEGLFSSQ